MSADELLNRLLSRGVAREVQPGSGASRAVRFKHIEVAAATDAQERSMRARWRERVGNSDISYLLIADDSDEDGSVLALGPSGATEPIRSLDCSGLAAVIEEAAGMEGLHAVRHVAGEIVRLAGRGMVVHGLLTRHTLESRLLGDPAYQVFAGETLEGLPVEGDWRTVLNGLGYEIARLEPRGYLARYEGRPVAVVHPKAEPRDFMRLDDAGRPAEGVLAADCRARGARYGILACHNRYRLFDCDRSASTAEWLDLDAGLLGKARCPYLALLAPSYLAEGRLAELQADAQAFGAGLRRRLDHTIRQDALPALAAGLERWARRDGVDLDEESERLELQRAAMTLLFRLLFVLYAEGSRFLPTDNPTYRRRSLSTLVAEAHQTRQRLSAASTALWSNFATLVRALRAGNPAWGVPAHNGSLFADSDFEGAELLERLDLDDPCFGSVLIAVGLDAETGTGVDYSSLEIGHLGHIYETLLSLQLVVADRALRYDAADDRYVADAESPDVESGSLLWQTHEGGRKAGGVYYTPVSLVRHLVRQAVLPAFERHLGEVRRVAETDPGRAAERLLGFAVMDPACGSAHFLVQVTEQLAERTVAFLAETPLPAIKAALDRLRAQALPGAEATDVSLLRRLVLKHCVYGVDVSPMGAEVAALSLWLASFVPGLSLAYLGRNVVVGNSLLGVASAGSVVREGTFQESSLRLALGEASRAAARVAQIDDLTPGQVEESRAADEEARAATEGLRRLFDLWTAEGFGLAGARVHAEEHGSGVIAGDNGENGEDLVAAASALAARHRFLHWPLEFPRVFSGERQGFDAVVGNPPWEEVTVEELSFYGLHLPGLHGLSAGDRRAAISELASELPELSERLQRERRRAGVERRALATGEYQSTKGDPDLYKYFCQRYRTLVRPGGAVGVVLPRAAFVTKGSEGFRQWLYTEMTARRVDTLLNKGCWMFDSEPRYGVALVVAERSRPEPLHEVSLLGTAASEEEWETQAASPGVPVAVVSLGDGWMTPRLRSQQEADLLAKLRTGARFPLGPSGRWKCFPVAELHETNDRRFWQGKRRGRPLWKGESFDQYDPHGAASRPCPASAKLWKKVRKPRPGQDSVVAQSTNKSERRQAVVAELDRARVAFRDVARSDDSRTVRACLVPPKLFLTNKAPYLAFLNGDETAQAACLGVMNSLPFDWQARRYVEINLNFFILEPPILPDFADEAYAEIAPAAARLSAVDRRFASFAAAVGVGHGQLSTAQRQNLQIEIDARVARAWKLAEADLETMFMDFTHDAVLGGYRAQVIQRFRRLG
ncbi:MAG: hypothetical protein OXC00_07170 [Acidimicrobiaceae bacterium]|nr:hypothetical protein [Acidimicrobiaceae bacterium]